MNSSSHPSYDITDSEGNNLSGKKIILCVTGSVAAVRSSEIARLLMRHGARVYPVMTKAATRLIHPDLLHWATGNQVITELTGAVEHVALAGNVQGKADLILIAPSTANTIGKIACGIDDTPVTTFATTALGEGIPMVIVPAMHLPMYNHPFVKENISKLEAVGITVLMPRIEEGKAKIAENEEILRTIQNLLARAGKLSGKRVLITAGRTVEYIDPIRVITNNSSGKMGVALAEAALEAGAEVTLIYGKGIAVPPCRIDIISVETACEMKDAVYSELENRDYHVCIAAAAVGDWQPKKRAEQKISTHDRKTLTIELVPTPKIIDGIKNRWPHVFLTAFRALSGLEYAELLENARERLLKAQADLIAVNDVSAEGAGFETDTNEISIVDKEGLVEEVPHATKKEVARKLIAVIASRIC